MALVPFAAAIVFVEQTLIRYLNLVTAAIARWPPIARLEAWLTRLPPYWALLTFVAPSILILPIKLSAFWFGMHHQYGLALAFGDLRQDAGDGNRGAALSRAAADPDGDSAGSPGPTPSSSPGATGPTPS